MSWRFQSALFCLCLVSILFLHIGNTQQCSQRLWEQQDRHTFPSQSFFRHIDCQVDISVSVTWHLADWAEVASTAIAGPAEKSRCREEGKYRAKYRGGGGGRRGGKRDTNGKQRKGGGDWSKGGKGSQRRPVMFTFITATCSFPNVYFPEALQYKWTEVGVFSWAPAIAYVLHRHYRS